MDDLTCTIPSYSTFERYLGCSPKLRSSSPYDSEYYLRSRHSVIVPKKLKVKKQQYTTSMEADANAGLVEAAESWSGNHAVSQLSVAIQ